MFSPLMQPVRLSGASFPLLGVQFRCPGLDRIPASIVAQLAGAEDELARAAADAILRQRRSRVAYWDVLTFHERTVLSRPGAGDAEQQILHDLRRDLGRSEVPVEAAERLSALPGLSTLTVDLVPVTPAILRPGRPGSTIGSGRDATRARRASGRGGLVRILSLTLERQSNADSAPDWTRLVTLATLAHLKTDLEIWVETGYLRVRRCARDACRSWYKAERLADRQRFCSAYCRVTSARTPK